MATVRSLIWQVQHVANSLLGQGAFSYMHCEPTTGGGAHRVSPRVAPHRGLPSPPSAAPAPFLPKDMHHHHRRCIKHGQCSCAERLAASLGAGDPQRALERLFERQLRLLLAVRKLWRQAEQTRGELPAVPKLPPLHESGIRSEGLSGTAADNGGDLDPDLDPADALWMSLRRLPQRFSDLYMPAELYGGGGQAARVPC
jgi:hypothetical protein